MDEGQADDPHRRAGPPPYHIAVSFDHDTGQWMADVEELPVHTWGPTTHEAVRFAREALRVHLGASRRVEAIIRLPREHQEGYREGYQEGYDEGFQNGVLWERRRWEDEESKPIG
jgi:predicted RNase H-like HicB family nuclease